MVKKRESKPKQLLDLPHEILDLIFNQIPHEYLKRIKDIEQIKPYVLSRLYSSIFISASRMSKMYAETDYYSKSNLIHYPSYDNIIRFKTFKSFVRVVNKYRLTKPKQICVYGGINVFIKLYNRHPEIFKEGKISIIPTQKEIKKQDFQKLKSIPCDIDEFIHPSYESCCSPGNSHLGYFSGGNEWMNRIKRVAIGIDFIAEEFYNQPFFMNLNVLKIRTLQQKNVKHIPRNLKKLECLVLESDESIWELPETLESLRVVVVPERRDEERSAFDYDFAYLTNLKDLTIEFSGFSGKVNYEFPSSLVTLKFASDCCNLTEENISACPNLSSIDCLSSSISCGNGIDGNPFRFSNKLKELKVSCNFLVRKAIEKYRNMEEPPNKISVDEILPESLQSLTIMYECTVDLAFDCEFLLDLSKFKHLNFFSSSQNNLKVMNFPMSITTLNFCLVNEVNLEELKNLMNLEILDFSGMALPDLEMKSPNLMNINISCSWIHELTPKSFNLPSNVLEIRIFNSRLEFIDESFEFPPNLEVLILTNNELSQPPPPSLPSKLKVMHVHFPIRSRRSRVIEWLKFWEQDK